MFIPRDRGGAPQQDTKILQNGSRLSSSDTLCAIATRVATGSAQRASARAVYACQVKHYPVVELLHGMRLFIPACVHIHFQSTSAEFEDAMKMLSGQGVTVVGGDFNFDLNTHPALGTTLFAGGDMHSPTFPTDTRGSAGNTVATRLDFIVTLDKSLSSAQRVSTAISNDRRNDHSFEHSDHRAVEALVSGS
eukprot:SAG22_NODE_622_length_8493_cov_196.309864_6_plen_192_part_00